MVKPFLQKVFRRLGYTFTRISPSEKIQGPLRFGPFVIETESRELLRFYHEFPEINQAMARVLRLVALQGPAAMIDIGANCGDTLAISKAAFNDLEVLCIEGDESLFGVLSGNCRQFSGVTLKNVFLGEERKEVLVSMEKEGWNNTLVEGDGSQAVQLETVDNAVSSWSGLKNLRFIKCDTEGYDVRILFGARETLFDHQPILFFEYNRAAMAAVGEEGFRIFPYLWDLGYRTILFYDNLGRFLMTADLSNQDLLQNLHDYADGKANSIHYYDIIVFAERDGPLAERFVKEEQLHRGNLSRGEA